MGLGGPDKSLRIWGPIEPKRRVFEVALDVFKYIKLLVFLCHEQCPGSYLQLTAVTALMTSVFGKGVHLTIAGGRPCGFRFVFDRYFRQSQRHMGGCI